MTRRTTMAWLAAAAAALSLACGEAGGIGGYLGEPAPASGEEDPAWNWSEERIREEMTRVTAGRDLTPEVWPGGARVAVLLSFDVDGGTVHLEGRPPSPRDLSRGAYGPRRGLGRVLRLLSERGIPASFFVPAATLVLNPGVADSVRASGPDHELAVHGWIHEQNTSLPRRRERQLTRRAFDYLEEAWGRRPAGYRAPSWDFSPNTLGILRELDVLYDSSLMADDRPYELLGPEGEPTGIVELPVSWILDDWPHMNPMSDRYAPPRQVLRVWQDEFDLAYREGTMFLLTMHPQVIGRRSRFVVLRDLLGYIESRTGEGDVWYATHRQAAEYVAERAGM